MKRKTLLLMLLMALFSSGAWAQSAYYSYSNITSSYSGATLYNNGTPANLLDNSLNSKYCPQYRDDTWPTYSRVDFESNDLIIPTGYVIYTGDDTQQYPGRNPKNWTIQAKVNSSDSWTTIHTVTNAGLPATNKTAVTYSFSNTTAYKYFRFEITAIVNGGIGQLQDFHFIATVQGGGVSAPTEIRTVADWNDFCAAVNSGHSYSGETVTLMNDITTAVTTMAGETTGESTYNYAFKGTFDGQGHTLTVNLTSGTLSGSWYYTAPFRVIDGAIIKNLKTTGTVTQNSGKGATGLAGYTAGTCTITNCVSNVTINSLTNGDGTHGGFFSEIRGTTTMNNCAFTGSITGSNTYDCGGFVGWKSGTATFNNCVFAPTEITYNYTYENSANFSRNGGTFNNCYYTQTCGTGWTQGKLMHSITGALGITITVANAGTATSYTPETSTIVGYGTGIKFNNILYAGSGDNVSLTLSGGDNYMVDHGTLTGSGSSYTLQMADYDTYIFVPITVSVSANPNNGGTVSGGGQYGNGASATVSAIPTGTYCFVNWTENGTVVSTDLNYTFTVTGARTLVANFSTFDASDITVSGNTNIACGTTTTLTASGLNGVAYNWYSDAACTQLVQENSATLTTPALTENTTYYVKAVGGTSYMEPETTFSYTGSAQTYNVPSGATALKMEVWGAQGGYRSSSTYGGKGGYSIGTLSDLNGVQNLYVYVGGSGNTGRTSGGYNGGGSRDTYNGGGGATHIATRSGLLSSLSSYQNDVLVVAGGGGSDGASGKNGMYGGGETGGTATQSYGTGGQGGTQTAGGTGSSSNTNTQGSFGQGGKGFNANSGYAGAGGGGWYGGAGSYPDGSGDDDRGGGGGSGHVNAILTDAQTIAGDASMPNPNGGTMTGREGNGYARITAYVIEECESAAVAVTVTVSQPSAPTNVTASNITSTGATVSWNGSASSYSYSIDNGSTWNNTNATSVNLTGLTYGTAYTFQVKAISGNCESSTASTTFTTQDQCTLSITGFGNQGLTGRANYYLIASPMQGSIAATSVTNLTSNTYNFYMFDQTGNNGPTGNATLEWINYIQPNNPHPFTNMVNGTGYLYANINNVTLTFTGTFYNGNGVVTLTRNDYYRFAGWNLVGNPFHVRAYPSKSSFYVMNSTGDRIIPAERNYVEPMEGLFVIADTNGETMTFSTTAPSKKNARLVLNVCKDDTKGNVVDRAIVNFNGGQELPKFQILNKDTKLYVTQESKEYAIVNAEPVGYLPVNFKAEENGSYMLSFVMEEANFNYLHLIDNMTGADIDLLALRQAQGPATYTFNAKTTDYESRFKLVFAASDVDGSSTGSETFAFYSNGVWVINNEGDATLQVIDVLGHVLSSDRISGATTKAINAASGIYMLRLINGDNVKVQKIVVR